MKSTHIVVAVVSVACSAILLQPVAADTDVRHVIARADAIDAHRDGAVGSQTFAEYAGRYEIDDGAAFIIDDNGAFVSIELPEKWGGAKLRLRAQSAHDFVAETPVAVQFQVGSDGRVAGLLFYPEGEEHAAVAATKVFPRGIVTIHDVPTPEQATTTCASELACS